MIGTALSTRNLVKKYSGKTALDNFTLSVPEGAVMGMVGPNGAGKTTWMMTVAGFLLAQSGEIDILGRGPFDAAIHSGQVTILPQDSELPLYAHPGELLRRYARLQGLSRSAAAAAAENALAAVNLSDRATSPVRTLSHGMRKRLMLAQCFLASPRLVLLDEPLNGLDPAEAERVRKLIISGRGRRTIVISSHNLDDISRLCTHVAFVEKGRVVRVAPLRELVRQSGQVVYTLAAPPEDRSSFEASLAAVVDGVFFEWRSPDTVMCTFPSEDIAEVNAAILPVLLKTVGVLSVDASLSLGQASGHACA